MKRKNNILRLIIYSAVSAFFLIACGNEPLPEGQSADTGAGSGSQADGNSVTITPAQYKTVGISLGSPEMRVLSGVLKVNGYIDVPPQNLVSVTSQMGGVIVSTPLLQGSKVSKGQVIAVLQNQEYVQLQQDYLESKNQLELTAAEYTRQQTLAEQNVNAQKTLQQAKAQYQSAQIRESALKQRLQLIHINTANLSAGTIQSRVSVYAPISGYVTKVNVNTGKFINANDVMFEIVNNANLHVELDAFEKDVSKVKAGQQVRFTMTNDTIEQKAVVELVGGEVKPDKTVTVHAIAKDSRSFIPGTYVNAFIETGSNRVMALPQEAIVNFEGKEYIFVAIRNGNSADGSYQFEMVEIATGIIDDGFSEVQIPENLHINGNVVLKGAYDLLSEMKNSED